MVPPDSAKAWLAPLPVSRLWGAGPKTEERLHQLGLHTIGSVAEADPRFLSTKLGSAGLHFYNLAHAEDPRPVLGSRMSKSIGSENTLDKDLSEKADIKFHMRRSADARKRRSGDRALAPPQVRVDGHRHPFISVMLHEDAALLSCTGVCAHAPSHAVSLDLSRTKPS